MAAPDKDTIYVDIDDEITGIIDKLRNSDAKVVALVLPKRATVFQSIVNMKLVAHKRQGCNLLQKCSKLWHIEKSILLSRVLL